MVSTWLMARPQRNFITHYILKNFLELSWSQIASLSDYDKYEIANAFLATFWFVGDYRLCDDFITVPRATGSGISASAMPHNTCAELRTKRRMDAPHHGSASTSTSSPTFRRKTYRSEDCGRHGARRGTTRAQSVPVPLEARSSSFIGNEASRFVNQILRRVQRRWGSFDPAPGPGPARRRGNAGVRTAFSLRFEVLST